jgi:hypothetical protein
MDFSIFINFGNKLEASSAISLEVSALSFNVFLISSSESRFSSTSSSSLISISGKTSSSIDCSISFSTSGKTSSSSTSDSISGASKEASNSPETTEAKSALLSSVSNGSTLGDMVETESIFDASYPCVFNCIDKRGHTPPENISVGHIFEAMCIHYGFEWHEAGKVMGLSAYGKPNNNIPKILINGRANPEVFDDKEFIYEYETTFQNKADFAYAVQKECQEFVISYILKAIELTGNKNVCLSGGFFLNCVANYEYLKHLPEGTNLYVEPISGDAGLSIGVAKHIWHYNTSDIKLRKQTNQIKSILKSFSCLIFTKDLILSTVFLKFLSNLTCWSFP